MQPNLFCLAIATLLTVSYGVAFADSISSVSCSTPTAALTTGSASCSALGSYGYANASASSSVALPASANQAAVIDTYAGVSALLAGIHGITSVSTAASSSNVAINFDTDGAVRNGYLELNFLQNSWTTPIFGSSSELLTIGSYSASPDGQNLSLFIPIQLGSEFNFTYLDNITVNGDAATGPASGSIGSDISLQAFEADQTTPVELFDPPVSIVATPEPATLGMMAMATLVAVLLIHKSRA